MTPATPGPDAELDRLSTLYVAVVADVLDRMSLRHQVMDSALRPVHRFTTLTARASTIQAVPSAEILDNPYEHELAAVDALTPGSVAVINTGGTYDAAVWGELLATRAISSGAVGAIVDGGARDIAGLEALEFPVFAASVSANDSYGRLQVIGSQEPVICGGVAVRPGDVVMADRDGVVVIPSDVAGAVAEEAARKQRKESAARDDLTAGVSAVDVYERHGVL
jgi:4-hydroxy-4-methyl-2-oxoglutarate aldolase